VEPADTVRDLFLGATGTRINTFPEITTLLESPSTEPEDEVPPELQFGAESSINYTSYRLDDNATLVDAHKESSGHWGGVIDLGGTQQPLNIDAVIETAYKPWPIPVTEVLENSCYVPSDTRNNPATA
tara:strand:- start:27542 stop:27925 length:384 start_codon:yes stop_codon:yes gene_type:complete